MKKNVTVAVASVSALALLGVALSAGNFDASKFVEADGIANSAVITTQKTAGSGNFDIATSSTSSHVTGTYTGMLDLVDTDYDFTAAPNSNINFHIGGTITQFSYYGKAHGNNMVIDLWGRVVSGGAETLIYRCNKADGLTWYGGQTGKSAISGATDTGAEHLADISLYHYFRITIWQAGGTSMSIKTMTFNWTC